MQPKVMDSSRRKTVGKIYLFIIQKYKAVASMRRLMTAKRLSMKLARARKVLVQTKSCPSKFGTHNKALRRTGLRPAAEAERYLASNISYWHYIYFWFRRVPPIVSNLAFRNS
jgi:hypothetical protein